MPDVPGRGPEPGPVEGGLELRRRAPDEAGVLHLPVADVGQGGEGAFEVDRELVAQGVELDADLADRHAALAAVTVPAGLGRLRDQARGARADGDRAGRGRAQDTPAAQRRNVRSG